MHRNNSDKTTHVNAARREKPLMLERFLLEEDRWKMFLVVGSAKSDGIMGTSRCSFKDKNMSAKISEGINENEYTGE